MKISTAVLLVSLYLAAAACSFGETKIRVGHFPNITHAQGVVAHALSRQGKGWFELGPGTKIEWFVYNAGPSAMEAIFAKSIDLAYVGPGPALNAYTKSNGQEIRLIAGAANGGAGLVVQPDESLKAPADFRGKKNCHTAAWQHAGHFLSRMANRWWIKNHPARRRRTGHSNAKSGPVSSF